MTKTQAYSVASSLSSEPLIIIRSTKVFSSTLDRAKFVSYAHAYALLRSNSLLDTPLAWLTYHAIRDWNGRYDLQLDCGYDQRVTISRIPT